MGAGELLSIGQAARPLGCSRRHVVDLCERGELPFVSAGSHWRVRVADVTALASIDDATATLWITLAGTGQPRHTDRRR